jgi:3-deoxy-D-manno-octulosonate 8-phosphate phosphatase (KDO 8-P phosphatase)
MTHAKNSADSTSALSWPDEIYALAKNIRLAIFDVDGVLTDGGLHFTDDGREIKSFNVKDGLGLKWLNENGITVAIITGRNSLIITERMAQLGIDHVYQGRMDKLETYQNLLQALGLDDSQVVYTGDDIIDLPVMHRCALPVAVRDAHPLVLQQARWVTRREGGRAAAREVCDLLLSAQGILPRLLEKYS